MVGAVRRGVCVDCRSLSAGRLERIAGIGITGMGRVLFSFSHVLLLLLPLLALTFTGLEVNRSRDDGTFELLFSQPLSRTEYFVGISLVRLGAVLVPLGMLFSALAFLGWAAWGRGVPWLFLGRSFLVSTALLIAFTGAGLLTSVCIRNQARALIILLVVWLAGVARMALLSSADPTLANLGPVGFYLANRIGETSLLALGTVWPLGVGLAAWLFAHHRFVSGDLL